MDHIIGWVSRDPSTSRLGTKVVWRTPEESHKEIVRMGHYSGPYWYCGYGRDSEDFWHVHICDGGTTQVIHTVAGNRIVVQFDNKQSAISYCESNNPNEVRHNLVMKYVVKGKS